ncbi:MAG: prolyl oligopeptidase family serine peptidase, partial [Fimbriimonadaceae bacterium]|nr:prolyl oligopeptidase family serine peptidase [Fimbriimonadaceae bacterium]
ASGLRFSADSLWLAATVRPKFEETRQATRERKPTPKNKLALMNLKTGAVETIDDVATWTLGAGKSPWLLYRIDSTPARPAPARGSEGGAADQEAPAEEKPKADEAPKKKAGHGTGTDHTLRNLKTGEKLTLESIQTPTWSSKGEVLAFSISNKEGDKDGVTVLRFTGDKMERRDLMVKMARYSRLTLNEDGSRIAFLTDADDYAAKESKWSVYWGSTTGTPARLQESALKAIERGYQVDAASSLRFSKSAGRLFIGLRPEPQPAPPTVPDDEKVNLDVWNWKDPQLQLVQLRQVAGLRNRTFDYMVDLASGTGLQLENGDRPSVQVVQDGDGSWALYRDSDPYQMQTSWTEGASDIYVVDLATNLKRLMVQNLNGVLVASPSGRWIVGADDRTRELFSIDPTTGQKRVMTGLPHPMFDEENDVPAMPSPYGIAGWLDDDAGLLVYDRFDLWRVDPSGEKAPQNLTLGHGRRAGITYRLVRLNAERPTISPEESLVFTAFDNDRKGWGYALGSAAGKRPEALVSGDRMVTGLVKAEESDRILFTIQNFETFPDLWTSRMDFRDPVRLSDANPQQKEYLWGTSEKVSYRSHDGVELDGILIKPGGFDPSKKYPMVVYFYDRSSQNTHRYSPPAPSASVINLSFFASNGYVIFVPDIPYKIGYPGESAVNAILPGVHKVLDMGFVDPKRVGIQGQSWGGYQVTYLVTETDMFAAACAGAPVSNMFSAYGGIRYGSGLVRQFQYEVGQSRIGGSMWEMPLRYLENSPIFFADKIKTPLLIMSNDQDGAVPWTEGIQLFTALRRLQRPAWMLVYNGEDHNLVQRRNRKDFTIRLSQFFDHYLKGDPMPVWMADGIPASEKGRTMGLELKMP